MLAHATPLPVQPALQAHVNDPLLSAGVRGCRWRGVAWRGVAWLQLSSAMQLAVALAIVGCCRDGTVKGDLHVMCC